MSSAWSWFVIILTGLNVLACVWLITWTSRKRTGEASTGDVTGHKWDGDLEEYNNPLPLWWLMLFYLTIIFGIGYLVLFPGMGNYKGMLGWTSEGQYQTEMQMAENRYGDVFAQFAGITPEELVGNEAAIDIGARIFSNNCSVCHGSDGRGARGFPNLTDNDWQWGEGSEAILAALNNGRNAAMAPLGAAIGDEGTDNVAHYVLSLSDSEHDAAKAAAGQAVFTTFCVACHTAAGTGMQALGAPNLTDDIWLYGGEIETIKEGVMNGRFGVMPSQKGILNEDEMQLVTAYVLSLSNNGSGPAN